MKKLLVSLVLCLVIISLTCMVALAKQEVKEMKVTAFTDVDKAKGFYNYADWDAVHNHYDPNGGRVVGIVYDIDTQEYVKNAWIENLELDFKVKTDKNGRFEINNLPDGEFTWIVKAPGYVGAVYAEYPVNQPLGASIYSFGVSSKKSINSNFKLERSLKHDHDHDHDCETEHGAYVDSYFAQTDDFSVNAVHSGWPNVVNFTVMYNNVIYRPLMNNYLYYVVASELWAPTSSLYAGIPQDRLLQGFKAQAVVARTYADYQTRFYKKHTGYNLCSTTHCQVYNPNYTNQMTIDAVDQTSNQMLLVIYSWPNFDYDFVESVFSASCTGRTLNNEAVWGGTPRSYLRGVTCQYDLRPTLKSGHNVGLCQDGAIGYAKNGWNYIQILAHFFQGTTNKVCNPQVR